MGSSLDKVRPLLRLPRSPHLEGDREQQAPCPKLGWAGRMRWKEEQPQVSTVFSPAQRRSLSAEVTLRTSRVSTPWWMYTVGVQ